MFSRATIGYYCKTVLMTVQMRSRLHPRAFTVDHSSLKGEQHVCWSAQLAQQHKPDSIAFNYTKRDAIIYALGVGCRDKKDVRYVYEGADGFMPLPTYVVTPGLPACMMISHWPGIQFDPSRILHGDQYVELYAPLPAEGSLRSETRVVDVIDKGSGALIMVEIITYEAKSDKKLAMQQFGVFQVGSGNFGGPRTSPHERKGAEIPKRPADVTLADATSADQAAFYRVGAGDLNPLHIYPACAMDSIYKTPVLHGLCTMGFASRHVLKAFANNDATPFKAMKVRFTTPVIPGQTLETHMWDEGDRVVFETKVKETGQTAISNGYMLMH